MDRGGRTTSCAERARVRGKDIVVGEERFLVRGVTYGTFEPDEEGHEFPPIELVDADFDLIAASGFNAVRTYTPPPPAVLDAAAEHGLRLMVGLAAERYVGYLADGRSVRETAARIRSAVESCAGHPAVLCYAVGNEIPAPTVRLLGERRVNAYLEELVKVVREIDPGALVTYANYPSTEYLDLGCLDFLCFNVYLESQDDFEAYLRRLQNLAVDRPLLMAEIGLDSSRNGQEAQARALEWQVRSTLAAGGAGAFVYAWTDEWYRGGEYVLDWDFGLTDRARWPKPALESVRRAFDEGPFADAPQPRVSVVVCTYNGHRTIGETLDALRRLDYPDFEVIVVDDGSSNPALLWEAAAGLRLIRTENAGLSNARNVGLAAATGEIVVYIDDDAYPDPDWLSHLTLAFDRSDHVGIGGPNIPPPGDGLIAECVANAPGGPIHVLLTDEVAEHIPGCNMAFRRSALETVGGFDARFRTAGDDVDMCWRLQHQGWTVGFSPAPVVWHHRRNSVRAYLRQQVGYGKAEALLEKKWPEKYNMPGHVSWSGRVYGKGLHWAPRLSRHRIYHGIWGTAPFQSLYDRDSSLPWYLPTMPDWYLFMGILALISALGGFWPKLFVVLPLLALLMLASIVQASAGAARATFSTELHLSGPRRAALRTLTALLYVAQPGARLWGRVREGLTPWRGGRSGRLALPMPRRFALWREHWQEPTGRIRNLESALRALGTSVRSGGAFDAWDLEARRGALGGARLRVGIEEHGGGQQLVRVWTRPFVSVTAVAVAFLLGGLAAGATLEREWIAAGVLAASALLLGLRTLQQAAVAAGAVQEAVERKTESASEPVAEPTAVERRPQPATPRRPLQPRVRAGQSADD